MGKRKVSLGESGRFVKGKSEFPLRKVKEAEKDGKQAISGAMEDSENALHLFYCHIDFTDFTDFFVTQKKRALSSARLLTKGRKKSQKPRNGLHCKRLSIRHLQGILSVKPKNNLKQIEKKLGVYGYIS